MSTEFASRDLVQSRPREIWRRKFRSVRSFIVTTSKALVTRSDALVTTSFLAPSKARSPVRSFLVFQGQWIQVSAIFHFESSNSIASNLIAMASMIPRDAPCLKQRKERGIGREMKRRIARMGGRKIEKPEGPARAPPRAVLKHFPTQNQKPN